MLYLEQDADAFLDWEIEWPKLGAPIESVTLEDVSSGIQASNLTHTDNTTTVWVSLAGQPNYSKHRLTLRVVSEQSQVDDQTLEFTVVGK